MAKKIAEKNFKKNRQDFDLLTVDIVNVCIEDLWIPVATMRAPANMAAIMFYASFLLSSAAAVPNLRSREAQEVSNKLVTKLYI